ncbi:MAG: hypothetical protein ACYCYI_14705 [Saccharofermentanales bacterium]
MDKSKKLDIDRFTDSVIENSDMIPVLIEIMNTDKGTAKFYCDKIIRNISEKDPKLIYPYFDDLFKMIRSDNSFIKWGAIITISNLISVDDENKFNGFFREYFSLLETGSMVAAANVICNAWKILKYKPYYENEITGKLLGIDTYTYLYKGEPSCECKNILIGHVLDCFDKYFDISENKTKMLEFASRHIHNERSSVSKKAENFLKKNKPTQI